jgi:hypothetical protein
LILLNCNYLIIQGDLRGIMSLTKLSMQPTIHFRTYFAKLFKKITIWIHDGYQSLLLLLLKKKRIFAEDKPITQKA